MIHQLEARCECGARWRVFADVGDDDEPDDAAVVCEACGAAVIDVRDLGAVRSAGRGST